MKNYYEALGVPETATAADIKHAYRQLALRLHPDRNPDPAARTLFLEIQEAYDVLGDRHRRLAYELLRQRAHELAQRPRPASPHDAPSPVPISEAVARARRRRAEQAARLRAYLPRARRFNWLMVALCLSLALDWALPLRHYPQETVLRKDIVFVSSSRADPRIAYVVSTPHTHFRLRDHYGGLLRDGDPVQVWRTPLWRFVRRVKPVAFPAMVPDTANVFGTLAAWPALLLVVAVVGLLPRISDETRLNTAVAGGLLLLVVAYMIYASW